MALHNNAKEPQSHNNANMFISLAFRMFAFNYGNLIFILNGYYQQQAKPTYTFSIDFLLELSRVIKVNSASLSNFHNLALIQIFSVLIEYFFSLSSHSYC